MSLKKLLLVNFFAIPFIALPLIAQDSDDDIEEVVAVGSQIKGAKITGILPVTVLSADDIEATAAVDGDELVENLVEQGLNFFNEVEQTSGGVNAARGDVGAYNIRSMGVGNTLTLLNGRRLVMNAGYQTEYIGGDFVPTMTVNSNMIATNGLDRIEVLKDGASAIYGADAVAGVVNNVMQTDYEGFQFSFKTTAHDHFAAEDIDFSMKYGFTMNGGATNVSIFAKHRDRERIEACEDDRWCDGNYERYLDPSSPWFGKGLDNRYGDPWYQIDLSQGSYDWADSSDQAEMGIIGIHDACNWEDALDTGFGTCLYSEKESDLGGLSKAKTSPQTLRDYRGDLQRTNLFVFVNHEMENGYELFAEMVNYRSSSVRNTMQGSHTSSLIYIPANYYWFTQIPGLGIVGQNTKNVELEAGRSYNRGREVNVDKRDFRYLLGIRGTYNDWDWESAVVYSKAKMNDLTKGRMSYQRFHEEFNNPRVTTPEVFNIFDPNWDTNNGDRLFVDVSRDDESTLTMIDFKATNSNIMDLPAGSVAMLLGLEVREEEYIDDRDDLLDGTVKNADFVTTHTVSSTKSHPYTSVVVGSSPTSDVMGDKTVASAFVEFAVPVTEKIDAQIALRHENFSDSDNATVGKLALGYNVSEKVALRASYQTAFRPPNLVQVNQEEVARTGSRTDALMQIGNWIENNKTDVSSKTSNAFLGDYVVTNSIRYATGAENLVPEESTNSSFGVIYTPSDNLTLTVDRWSIEKENTIGLFGRVNHSVYDLLLRKRIGIGGLVATGTNGEITAADLTAFETWCRANVNTADSTITNKYIVPGSAVLRDAYWGTSDDTDAHNSAFFEAGVCPAGEQDIIRDEYLNLATREVEGTDFALYYDIASSSGDYKVTYKASVTDKFHQEPVAKFAEIESAIASGELPAFFGIEGYGDLLGLETTGTDRRDSLKISYRNGDWGYNISALKIGEIYDSGVKLVDGTMWRIPSMKTTNVSFWKKFDQGDYNLRIMFAVKNITDNRAPLADGYLGFYSDVHRDLGRNYYLDLRMDF